MNKNYDDYLRTIRWKRLSEETKRLAGFRCQICNSNKNLNAHHRTYERLGEELQSDLVCLCNACHKLFHEKMSKKETHKSSTLGRMITVILKPSGDPSRDRRRIKNIYGILISSPGKDCFRFEVVDVLTGKHHFIDFPYDSTNIVPDTLNRLEKLLVEKTWRIENISR
jgi:hypothetical protein